MNKQETIDTLRNLILAVEALPDDAEIISADSQGGKLHLRDKTFARWFAGRAVHQSPGVTSVHFRTDWMNVQCVCLTDCDPMVHVIEGVVKMPGLMMEEVTL